MRLDKETFFIRRAWNSGMTLSKAAKYMRNFGFANVDLWISEWRIMKKKFRHASLSWEYLYGYPEKPSRLHVPSERELASIVGPGGMTYGDWKGITGPGKQLRDILANT